MIPPRLHVVTALASPLAVVLRRGPAEKVASLGWNRSTGEITMGQWLAGRIHEYRCDLSPDGRHLVYFAAKHSRPTGHRTWTAISRAPFLRAIHMVPKNDTWGGGGAFTADGALWPPGLWSGPGSGHALPDRLREAPANAFPYNTDGVGTHGAMLELRGWRHVAGKRYEASYARDLPGGGLLEHSYDLAGVTRAGPMSSYHLTLPAQHPSLTDWEWADLWQNRLQFAARGSLWQARIDRHGAIGTPELVHDFSAISFTPLPAPYEGVTKP